MKKIIIVAFVFVSIVGVAVSLPKDKDYNYLRLHIRANSDSVLDQNIKYEIKDYLVKYLTPFLVDVESKTEAENIVKIHKSNLEKNCENILMKNGFNYSVNINLKNEYFPTRTYLNTTLESGFYDAVVVELGKADGDNWWCVMYPPLCFVNKNESSMQIKYKSKIFDWFKKIF